MNAATAERWILRAEAARRLGIDDAGVDRLIERRLLTVRELPGSRPRVLAADVERLAERSTRPAEVAPA